MRNSSYGSFVRPLAFTILSIAATGLMASACKKSSSPTTPTPPPPAPVFTTANPTGSTANLDARTSMKTPANSGTFMFDDFVSTEAATITKITWQGIYCAEVLNRAAPAATATDFEVGFYPDSGNNPNRNSPIQLTVYPVARVAETRGTDRVLNCGAISTGWSFYDYSLTLDTPFQAAANVRYWISIQARVPYLQANNNDFIFWGWRNGVQNNARSIQYSPTNVVTEHALDRAYSLIK
ncbi:MAG: hypothetical protein IPL75_02185 [Acidobacteria bacterium]|nr:hypothetical protein [Acidobacteriota bacterium]